MRSSFLLSSSTNGSISEYNVLGSLGGVGRTILAHVVHEMNDGHDIQQFLTSSSCLADAKRSELFPWSLSHSLAQKYMLQSVPFDRTAPVCLRF